MLQDRASAVSLAASSCLCKNFDSNCQVQTGSTNRAAAFLGEHFRTVKGYNTYQEKAEIARKGWLVGAVNGFMQPASWGTPDRMLRELEVRRSLIDDFGLNVAFGFGGTPYAIYERGLRLFAKEVLPVLKSWQPVGAAKVAA